MQYPVEIPGVNNIYFLKAALNAVRKHRGEEELDAMEFLQLAREKMKLVELDEAFMNRAVNEGFSGGEKKRNEIFQMAVLDPKLAILDETDSGLDIDALRIVAEGVNALRSEKHSVLVITHYQRLLTYLVPDFVHVLADGRIVKSGGKELAEELEQKGYEWIEEEVRPRDEQRSRRSLTIAPVTSTASRSASPHPRAGRAALRRSSAGRRRGSRSGSTRTSRRSRTIDWKTRSAAARGDTIRRIAVRRSADRGADVRQRRLHANRRRWRTSIPESASSDREAMADESFAQHFARYADYEKHAMTALNTANVAGRRATSRSPPAPSSKASSTCSSSATATDIRRSHPRNLIVAGRGSQVTVVETYVGNGTLLHEHGHGDRGRRRRGRRSLQGRVRVARGLSRRHGADSPGALVAA